MASSWSWASTTARERPWLRRDSDRPIDSSEDAWPSGLSIQSASSAAAAFLRDVKNADTASGTSGAGSLFGGKLFERDLFEPQGFLGDAGQLRFGVRVGRRAPCRRSQTP